MFIARIFLLALVVLSPFTKSWGQDHKPPMHSNNYYKNAIEPNYGFYVLGGLTTPFTDVHKHTQIGVAYGLLGEIKATYYLNVAFDLQKGNLSAGDPEANRENKLLKFSNQFFTGTASVRFTPLKLMNTIEYKSALYYLSNVYMGVGLGLLKSDVTANLFQDRSFKYIGNYKGFNLVLPLELGISVPMYEWKYKRNLSLNINYRMSFVTSDRVDGYITPQTHNARNDTYGILNIGLGYCW
jgi:hypothetical protein